MLFSLLLCLRKNRAVPLAVVNVRSVSFTSGTANGVETWAHVHGPLWSRNLSGKNEEKDLTKDLF